MKSSEKYILVIDALTIRWGGGLVLLDNLLKSIVRIESLKLYILLNPQTKLYVPDSVAVFRPSGTQSALGAVLYRITFLNSFLDKIGPASTLLTFNSWSRSSHKQITIHINTIPFLSYSRRVKSVGFLRGIICKFASQNALKMSALNIFESQYLLDIAYQSFGQDIVNPTVHYFGSDMKRPPFNELLPHSKRVRRMITVTSAAGHKQNYKVIEAFQFIRNKYPDFELCIVGNESLIRREIDKINPRLDYSGIEFTGYVSRDVLAEYIEQSEILISLSTTESFYLVAIEAMFLGTPVIAKWIPAVDESCDEYAKLVRDETPENILEAYEVLSNMETWKTYSEQAYIFSQKFESTYCLNIVSNSIYEASRND